MAVDGVTNCTGDLTIARQRPRIAKGLVRFRHRIHLRDAQPEVLKIVGLRAQRETVEVLRSCEKLLALSAKVERSRTSSLLPNLHYPQLSKESSQSSIKHTACSHAQSLARLLPLGTFINFDLALYPLSSLPLQLATYLLLHLARTLHGMDHLLHRLKEEEEDSQSETSSIKDNRSENQVRP